MNLLFCQACESTFGGNRTQCLVPCNSITQALFILLNQCIGGILRSVGPETEIHPNRLFRRLLLLFNPEVFFNWREFFLPGIKGLTDGVIRMEKPIAALLFIILGYITQIDLTE